MTAAPSWTRWVVPLVFVSGAAGVRLWGITTPDSLYWDEQYYVFDAEVYLGGGIGRPIGDPPAVKIADEGTWVHPPGGKWIIALFGVGPLGNRPIGWRLPSAVFGIVGVALLYLLALRLWRSVWWAGAAALLLALDGLHIVQSRIPCSTSS
jgi:dolichyl-phosphate-mannose-protein mannosyltransferase